MDISGYNEITSMILKKISGNLITYLLSSIKSISQKKVYKFIFRSDAQATGQWSKLISDVRRQLTLDVRNISHKFYCSICLLVRTSLKHRENCCWIRYVKKFESICSTKLCVKHEVPWFLNPIHFMQWLFVIFVIHRSIRK